MGFLFQYIKKNCINLESRSWIVDKHLYLLIHQNIFLTVPKNQQP